MEYRLARAKSWLSGRQRRPKRPASPRVVLGEDHAKASTSEFCDLVAGRLVVAYDGAAFEHPRGSLQLSVDGARYQRLRGDLRPLGGRLLDNGDFRAGLSSWSVEGKAAGVKSGIDVTREWSLQDGHTAFIGTPADPALTPALVYVGNGREVPIPIIAGRDYIVTALVGAHRCQVQVRVEMLDETGVVLSTVEDIVPTDTRGGQHRADYHHTRLVVRAPDGAVSARLSFRKRATAEGEQDSFMFVADAQFGWDGEPLPAYALTPRRQESIRRWREPLLLSVRLPSAVLDGELHRLEMRDPTSGDTVCGPVEYPAAAPLRRCHRAHRGCRRLWLAAQYRAAVVRDGGRTGSRWRCRCACRWSCRRRH